jgi:radical SAM superfamily enzyme YgiQ (UPF0313 family)
MKSIQLINAPLAKDFYPSIRAGAYPPLHLACLASSLRKQCSAIDFEIIDGELFTTENIISRLSADIVAISCNSLTYDSALLIAESAKSKGAIVVLGGAHPTFVGREIIQNRHYIDAVVCGDGEIALAEIIRGTRKSLIQNIIYQNKGKINDINKHDLAIDELPFVDYSGIELESYFRNYQRLYPDKPFHRAFAIYSAKGCLWRHQTGGCIFCAVQHEGFRVKSAARFWEEIKNLQNNYGADLLWDVSDTFTADREWVRSIVDTKPSGIDANFQVYARASNIDEDMADLLSHIGVYEVFLGLDSGSDSMLRTSRKGATALCNIEALKRLNREGIKVIISLVIGLPGETMETLLASRDMIEDICSWASLSEINCSILLPLPGSHAMNMLKKFAPPPEGEEDIFNANALREAWVNNFCNVTYEQLIEEQQKIMKFHHRVGSFGVTKMEIPTLINGTT